MATMEKKLYFCIVFFIIMRKIRFILVLFLLSFPAQPLWAWGKTGHRVIAQVAYDNLNCRARRQVDKILGKHGIVYYANWADEIKSDTIYLNSYDWHYQDFDAGLTDSALISTLTHYPVEGGSLFRAMDSLVALLHREPENVDALRFVIHLMGDRFCPMHLAHLDDRGGTMVRLEWFKQPYNLHSIWDDGMIEVVHYSYSEYAEYVEDVFANQKKSIQQMSQEDILRHNYALTNEIYAYQASWNGNCWNYVYHFARKMEWQLYAAGIRLAMLLNEIYG
jgi:hypothetical protein